MKINFETLESQSKEELINIILHLKKYSEELTLDKRIAIDTFKAYRTSMNKSLDQIKKDFNAHSKEVLIKVSGKTR